ncbi:GerAB/ArcD/ProY family transporter [Paenibacillus sp. N3.4]|uniref:GerAB/ArcD/ProY family transporter n=1 Tax=Paenibacillus sp. N3.4 TaxID=2603222 RepID=UPI0011C8E076|nr:GerAB/ArcD/ProY family transporter [Paenibacillus sp. N3.4]TXK83734.1 GerAB/ArcD/ProY family transporter [Paenibacillus sp. N3.4]
MNKSLLNAFFLAQISLILLIYSERLISATSSTHWKPLLVSYVISGVFLYMYFKGLSLFPAMDIIQITSSVVGKWIARILFLPFTLYFFIYLVTVPRHHAQLLVITFHPTFPIWTLLLPTLLILMFGAILGIHAIIRASLIVSILCIPFFLLTFSACLQNVDFHYALPLWNDKFSFLQSPDFYSCFISFSSFLFLGLVPSKQNIGMPRLRYLLITYAALLPFYLLAAYLPITLYGVKSASKLKFPMVSVMDTINISWLFFDRITIFYVLMALISSYVYGAISLWAMTTVIHKLYISMNKTIITAVLTLGIFILGIWIPTLSSIDTLYGLNSIPTLTCMLGLPLGILIMAGIKRREAR